MRPEDVDVQSKFLAPRDGSPQPISMLHSEDPQELFFFMFRFLANFREKNIA